MYKCSILIGFLIVLVGKVSACGWKKLLSPGKKEVIRSHQDFDKMTQYSPNETCVWDIEATQNKVAEIKFNTFILDGIEGSCVGDVVKIWSGGNGFANISTKPDFEFCGTPKGLLTVTGKDKYMTIIFETDDSKQNIGFSAEVIERDPPCPPLNKDAVDLSRNPVFGITCQWTFKDSVDVHIGSDTFLREDDSISIYKQTDMSLIKQLRGPLQIKTVVVQCLNSCLVEFTSSPNSLIVDNKYGFDFRVVYNCLNLELIANNELISREEAKSLCSSKGPEWNILIVDKKCKHDKVNDLWRSVCRPNLFGGTFWAYCPLWVGLTLNNDTGVWYWENGNALQKSELELENWSPGLPRNTDKLQCPIIFRFNATNDEKWATMMTDCGNKFETFCSKVSI